MSPMLDDSKWIGHLYMISIPTGGLVYYEIASRPISGALLGAVFATLAVLAYMTVSKDRRGTDAHRHLILFASAAVALVVLFMPFDFDCKRLGLTDPTRGSATLARYGGRFDCTIYNDGEYPISKIIVHVQTHEPWLGTWSGWRRFDIQTDIPPHQTRSIFAATGLEILETGDTVFGARYNRKESKWYWRVSAVSVRMNLFTYLTRISGQPALSSGW